MSHKKLIHPELVPSCEKSNAGKCFKNESECWFIHRAIPKNRNNENPWPELVPSSQPRSDNTTKKPVFRETVSHALPPDQLKVMMDMISNLCIKVETMEKRFEDLMN